MNENLGGHRPPAPPSDAHGWRPDSVKESKTNRFDDRTVSIRDTFAGDREFKYQRTAKPYTALQTVRYRFSNIYTSSCVALAL